MADSDKYASYDQPEGDWIKVPGTLSGTKFHDIMPATGGAGCRLAARLCNFPTGWSALKGSHQRWLDDYVEPLISSLEAPWIDLFGYASQLGSPGANYQLSDARCGKVREYVSNYSGRVYWNFLRGKGASESATLDTNNDGWWRAVEVFMYGFKPPTATLATIRGFKDFEIRCLGSVSGSVGDWIPEGGELLPFGAHGFVFEITAFDMASKKASEKATFMHVSEVVSLPSVPLIPAVPTGFSSSSGGGPTSFHTSIPVELHDFQGVARIFQNPGVSTFGGNLNLSMESQSLYRRGAIVRPSMIHIEVSSSYFSGFSLGSAGTPGELKMLGTTKPI